MKLSTALDSNANQQSLLVIVDDVDSAQRSDLLPVRHRLSPDDTERPPPPESADVSDGGSTTAELDVEETARMTSPTSSSLVSAAAAAAGAGVVDCNHDAVVTPSDDVDDDVIQTQNYHDHRQIMSDKVNDSKMSTVLTALDAVLTFAVL